MAHGYMREYDEDRDTSRDSGDWRDERSDRDWRSDDDRRWREQGRDRGMMFGGDRDHDRDRNEDRGFFGRLGERARDSFRDDDRDHRHWGRESGHGQSDRGRGAWDQDPYWSNSQASSTSGWNQERQRSRSHPDDHYHSWRDKQMQSLDRDYDDYCREREQQFHSDFDSWRQQRYGGNPGPLRTGMTQTGLSEDPSGMAEAEAANRVGTTPPDPMDTATLGTTPRNKQSGK